jgi:hypothetical protein
MPSLLSTYSDTIPNTDSSLSGIEEDCVEMTHEGAAVATQTIFDNINYGNCSFETQIKRDLDFIFGTIKFSKSQENRIDDDFSAQLLRRVYCLLADATLL